MNRRNTHIRNCQNSENNRRENDPHKYLRGEYSSFSYFEKEVKIAHSIPMRSIVQKSWEQFGDVIYSSLVHDWNIEVDGLNLFSCNIAKSSYPKIFTIHVKEKYTLLSFPSSLVNLRNIPCHSIISYLHIAIRIQRGSSYRMLCSHVIQEKNTSPPSLQICTLFI